MIVLRPSIGHLGHGARTFHRIAADWPCLQALSAEPYIFAIPDFLSEAECDALIAKASSASGLAVTESARAQSYRLSYYCEYSSKQVQNSSRRALAL